MPLPGESAISLPLFDEAAAALKAGGRYRAELSADDLTQIMGGIVAGLLTGQERVRASVLAMDVRIEGERGTVAGAARVESPLKATVGVACVLGNDPNPSRIRLLDLDVRQEAGLLAKQALRAVNIEGRVRELLADPNRALFTALDGQLRSRGARLSALGLHFNQRALTVELHGENKPAHTTEG